ncbi:MAG: hypothetical protein WAV00_22020 [Nocardioides sp.]
MSTSAYAQLVGLCAGVLLLSSVLIVWRRSLTAQIRLLALHGLALAALVTVLGISETSAELLVVSGLVLVLKAIVLPGVLWRAVASDRVPREETPLINTTTALIALSLMTMLAFLVSRPLVALGSGPSIAAKRRAWVALTPGVAHLQGLGT